MAMTFDTDVTLNAAKVLKTNTINIPTSSGGTTYGAGSSGQVIKSNGTTVYWAADANTTYSSQAAASGGTAVSLCTTGEKYTWNNKQNAATFNYNNTTQVLTITM